jgi:hypothetical protein
LLTKLRRSRLETARRFGEIYRLNCQRRSVSQPRNHQKLKYMASHPGTLCNPVSEAITSNQMFKTNFTDCSRLFGIQQYIFLNNFNPMSFGICGGRKGTEAYFLPVNRYLPPTMITSTTPHSLIILSSILTASLNNKLKSKLHAAESKAFLLHRPAQYGS